MGDKMWWIHLGSTRCVLSLAQIRGLLLGTSLQSRLQYFFRKETLRRRLSDYVDNFTPNSIRNSGKWMFPLKPWNVLSSRACKSFLHPCNTNSVLISLLLVSSCFISKIQPTVKCGTAVWSKARSLSTIEKKCFLVEYFFYFFLQNKLQHLPHSLPRVSYQRFNIGLNNATFNCQMPARSLAMTYFHAKERHVSRRNLPTDMILTMFKVNPILFFF